MNPSDGLEKSIGYFHSSGRALIEQNMNVYESPLPSGHNIQASKVRAESLPYFNKVSDLDTYIISNPKVIKKYVNFAITEMAGTNGQSYYINDGGTFIQGWIAPVDVLNSAGMPADCYQARLYSNGKEVTPTIGQWWFEYYNGLIQFAEGYTPKDLGLPNLTITCYVYIGKTLSNISYSGSAMSWGYQTFNIGEIGGTTIKLTRNDNGIQTSSFASSKVISNTAVICQDSDDESFVYSGTTRVFSSKVKVLSHSSDTVTLSAIPHNVWGKVRIYYYYQYADGIPVNFYYPSRAISDTTLTELDVEFASEQDLANKTHNSLQGIQGGTTDDYQHLTTQEKAKYDGYDTSISTINGEINTINNNITDLSTKVNTLESGGTGGSTYTNSSSSVNSFGNVPSGVTFPTPQTMQQMWDFLLYYSPPLDSFYASTAQGVFEIGNSLTSLTLTNNITRKSNRITKIEYYKNNMLLYANNFPNANGGMDTYTDISNINSNTVYYSKIYDDKSYIISNSLQYKFVYPIYIGKLDNTVVTESTIKNTLTKVLAEKSNQSFNYTMTSQYFCIAYPTSYGVLKSILDPNGFEMINTFSITNTQFTMLDAQLVPYTIYLCNIPNTQMNFNLTYKFQ